jgi:hypothetical protein
MTVRAPLAAALLVAACSQSLDGPTPRVAAVTPNLICNAQFPALLTLAGDGFAPAVVGALGDDAGVAMPVVVWSGGGTSYIVPPANVTLPGGDRTGTKLATQIPTGALPPTTADAAAVIYAVEVTNPDGHAGTLANALTVVPPPSISSINPSSGAQGSLVDVTIMGLAFRAGVTVTLDAVPKVTATNVTVVSPTTITATFDLTGVAAGIYDVTVTNPEGCTFTLAQAFTVFVPKVIDVTGIDPPFGCTCAPTTVTISSATGGFRSTPIVELRPAGNTSGAATPLGRVAFIDETTLTAVVPAGLAPGTYDVTVINPPYDGGVGTLTAGFRVVMSPVPIVTATNPPGATTQQSPTVHVLGDNFRSPAKVELIGQAGTVLPFTATVISSMELTFPIAANGVPVGPYLVRVTDLDEGTYFTFSGFLMTQPSGKLNAFRALGAQLVTGRRLLAGVSADDDLGNHYVYAIGGSSGGAPLDTLELSQLSRFGELGAWKSIRNRLTAPRSGAAAVAVRSASGKTFVYVLGGLSTGGTVLGSTERAVVLATAAAPTLTGFTTASAAGTLDAGTWYYKVAAVLGTGDADNPGGETLSSEEEIVTLSAVGSISLSWGAVPGAASYRIYRTDAVNGRSQAEHLIGTTMATSFTDDGKAAGADPFLPDGSLGVWQVVGGAALGTARWGHQAVLTPDGAVVVLGGKTAAMGGVTASVEHAIADDAGALGAFASGTALPEGRAFAWAALETPANSKLAGTRILMTGGESPSATTLDTVVFSDVAAGGANGGWTALSKSTNSHVAGLMSVVTDNTIFMLGGAGSVAEGASGPSFSGVTGDGRQMIFDSSGGEGNSISSTSNALLAPRALGVVVQGAGFIYFIGGTSDGTNALRTVELTF